MIWRFGDILSSEVKYSTIFWSERYIVCFLVLNLKGAKIRYFNELHKPYKSYKLLVCAIFLGAFGGLKNESSGHSFLKKVFKNKN